MIPRKEWEKFKAKHREKIIKRELFIPFIYLQVL